MHQNDKLCPANTFFARSEHHWHSLTAGFCYLMLLLAETSQPAGKDVVSLGNLEKGQLTSTSLPTQNLDDSHVPAQPHEPTIPQPVVAANPKAFKTKYYIILYIYCTFEELVAGEARCVIR